MNGLFPKQRVHIVFRTCLSVVFFFALSVTWAQQTSYYRDLVQRGTPYAGLTPKSEIRANQVVPVEFYKAEFNEAGLLVRLEYYFQGKISARLATGPGRVNYGAPIIKISYESQKETREYLNIHGSPMRNSNGVFKDEYLLDKNGYRKTLYYYDSLGNRVANVRGIYRYEWETRENGALVIEKRYDEDGELQPLSDFMDFHITHMTFTPNGYRTGFINFGNDGKRETVSEGRKISRTRVDWDETLGNELQITFMGLDGKPKNLAQLEKFPNMTYGHAYEYYDHDGLGNQISFRTADQDGRLVKKPEDGIAYQYFPRNERGLVTKVVNYDEGMNIIPNASGAMQIGLSYDADGNMVRQSFLDYYGRLMTSVNGLAYQSFEWDSQGRMSIVTFHGMNGEVIELSRGVAMIKFIYDEKGQRTQEEYNRHGEPIEG